MIESSSRWSTSHAYFGKPIEHRQPITPHLDALVTDQTRRHAVTFNSALDSAIERAKEAKNAAGTAGCRSRCSRRSDEDRSRMLPEEFTILGGSPAKGKSALGWQMVISAAECDSRPVAAAHRSANSAGSSASVWRCRKRQSRRAHSAPTPEFRSSGIARRLTDLQLEHCRRSATNCRTFRSRSSPSAV